MIEPGQFSVSATRDGIGVSFYPDNPVVVIPRSRRDPNPTIYKVTKVEDAVWIYTAKRAYKMGGLTRTDRYKAKQRAKANAQESRRVRDRNTEAQRLRKAADYIERHRANAATIQS